MHFDVPLLGKGIGADKKQMLHFVQHDAKENSDPAKNNENSEDPNDWNALSFLNCPREKE